MTRATFLAATLLILREALGPAFVRGGLELKAEELRDRPTFCAVAEMQPVPEVDTWESCKPDEFRDQAEAFQAAWLKESAWVAGHVTPALVQALSHWSQEQMKKYATVPPLDKLKFQPLTAHRAHHWVVYEATADTLPTHAKIVDRWLKLYVLYNAETKTIVRVTVTIRGQVLE